MTLHLWEGYGIELEYMIVDRKTLAVKPIADELIKSITGNYVADYENGAAAWSNELVLHVVEFKTNGPAAALEPLPELFQQQVNDANRRLEAWDACLLPTGMHPFFDPMTETKIWPHEYNAVYETYNRIFDCRGHGWSNLQSMHINLPFADDAEFARLHAAVRYILPILPGLAASTPVAEGKLAPALDYRLVQYSQNSARIPIATGKVIPENWYTKEDYYREILHKIWAETAPFDPDGNLEGEYANARGAIARFDRMAIEIRVLDIQECPEADIAIAAAIKGVLQALTEGRWMPMEELSNVGVEPLAELFKRACVTGENTVISDRDYLAGLGLQADSASIGEVWDSLIDATMPAGGKARKQWRTALGHIRTKGTLATRIRAAAGKDPKRERLSAIYHELARCLSEGQLFDPAAL
ncbi:MAG: glutamate--cysteine ligase [Planctomycetes bacterium]|nr:glutamate--cysteine ligase [Planctomycetota bacterium]